MTSIHLRASRWAVACNAWQRFCCCWQGRDFPSDSFYVLVAIEFPALTLLRPCQVNSAFRYTLIVTLQCFRFQWFIVFLYYSLFIIYYWWWLKTIAAATALSSLSVCLGDYWLLIGSLCSCVVQVLVVLIIVSSFTFSFKLCPHYLRSMISIVVLVETHSILLLMIAG